MLPKKYIFDFLRDLSENNSKEWMDENRHRYHKAKNRWLQEIEIILKRLSKHDPALATISPKSTISRINNNRRFHPDKPVYKDFFTSSPAEELYVSSLHISVGPNQSFVGGGIYKPPKGDLDRIRAAFDYNGDRFKEIISTKAFQDFFGGLSDDKDEKLKTSPKGFDNDHPLVDLLRYKSIVATRNLTEDEVCSANFLDLVEQAYLILQPMNKYLSEAISFKE